MNIFDEDFIYAEDLEIASRLQSVFEWLCSRYAGLPFGKKLYVVTHCKCIDTDYGKFIMDL